MTSRRFVLALIAASAFVGQSAGPVVAASSVSSATSAVHPAASSAKWGWVTVRRTGASYAPAASDQGNSTGGADTVEYAGTGTVIVFMNGIGDPGGTVEVSPLGRRDRVCYVYAWGSTSQGGIDEQMGVICSTSAGTLVNTGFTLTFFAAVADAGHLAYLEADQDATTEYSPAAVTSFDSEGGANTIHREGPGDYLVTLPHLGVSHGDAQVTQDIVGANPPRQTEPAGTAPMTPCQVLTLYPTAPDETVHVQCHDLSGTLTDARFTLMFMDGEGLKGSGHGKVAYLWAKRPSTASYVPASGYRYAKPSATLTLSGMPSGGTVKLSPTGLDAANCIVGSIRASGSPQTIGVRCFDLSGAAADTYFMLAYER